MDAENSKDGKESIPAPNQSSNDDSAASVESDSNMTSSVEPVMATSEEQNMSSSVEPVMSSSVEPIMTSSEEQNMASPPEPVIASSVEAVMASSVEPLMTYSEEPVISSVEPVIVSSVQAVMASSEEPVMASSVQPVMASLGETDMASTEESVTVSSFEPGIVPLVEPGTINDVGGVTDQNDGTNTNQTIDLAPVVNKEHESGQITTPDESDNNMCKQNDREANVVDENKAAVVVKIEKDDDHNNDDNDDSREGVKTYSGYVPISQEMFDWEPPTSLDNQNKSTPPPDTNQGQSHDGNPDRNMFARKPVDGLVYTEVGEKARPTPYIYEIKARKFEKRRKNKLFVGGLVFEATKEFLYDLFEKYGELEDACIVTERGTGNSRGFGYVTFVNQDEAEEAIKAIDGLRIHGKTLCVEFADDPKSSPGRGPSGRSRGPSGRGRGRGYGRYYDMDRYPNEDPYYYDERPDPYYRHSRDDPYYDYPSPRDFYRPPPRDYDRPPPRDYDRPPSRDYDRPSSRDYDRPPPRDYGRPPPRDYDRPPPRSYDRPPPRDYERPPPRDYYRPPPRDYYDTPAYDHPPPRDYGDYRRPPASYDENYPPAPRREDRLRDVDVARLRVDREKVRREKYTSVDQQRLLTRQKKKQPSSSSSSSESSDSEATKAKTRKRHRVIPKAYMM